MPLDLAELRSLRLARDRMDREFAQPLTVAALAATAAMSPSHFSRRFLAVYGETPYAYLMTRRIERAKARAWPLGGGRPRHGRGGADGPKRKARRHPGAAARSHQSAARLQFLAPLPLRAGGMS